MRSALIASEAVQPPRTAHAIDIHRFAFRMLHLGSRLWALTPRSTTPRRCFPRKVPSNRLQRMLMYGAITLLVTFGGGCLPLLRQWSHRQLHAVLALATGVFLGAVFL